nr:hypothetical protein HmN_000274400 [Hymenolepis microstoma]
MQLDTVRHIIESHYDLAYLVTSAQPDTLVYIPSISPNFSKYLSKMSSHATCTFLHKIPYPCEYLQSIRRVDAENVVYKVPMFEECLPTTGTTEATYRPPADVDSLFKGEELEQMTAELPDIRSI